MIFAACLPKLPCHTNSVATSLTTSHYISPLKTGCRTQKKQSGEPKGNFPTPKTVCIQLLGAAESTRIGKSWTDHRDAGLQVLIPSPSISHFSSKLHENAQFALRLQETAATSPSASQRCKMHQFGSDENNDQRTLGK